MRKSFVPVGFLALVAAAACHYAPVQVTSNLTPVNPYRKYELLPRVTGEACTFKLLYLIPFSEDDRVAVALRKAVPPGSSVDDLTGVTVEEKTTIYIIGAEHCVIVSGYPVRYVDTRGKGGIFSYELNPAQDMARAEGVAVATPAPAPVPPAPRPVEGAPATAPAPTSEPAKAPARSTVVSPVVTTPASDSAKATSDKPSDKPAPAPAAPGGDGEVVDCGSLCRNFIVPIKAQSPVIQNIVFTKCVDKCNNQNMPFVECAMGVRTEADVSRCNQL